MGVQYGKTAPSRTWRLLQDLLPDPAGRFKGGMDQLLSIGAKGEKYEIFTCNLHTLATTTTVFISFLLFVQKIMGKKKIISLYIGNKSHYFYDV